MTAARKRIVILDHNRGRLANQLWNFMGIYAYCLEKGHALENHSFFDYAGFFNIPSPRNLFVRFFFFSALAKKKWYRRWRPYDRYVAFMEKIFLKRVIFDDTANPFYLPPSQNHNQKQTRQIDFIETSPYTMLYTHGWLFRNPAGIEKYRNQIKEYFQPKELIIAKINSFLSPLRKRFKHIVGVHIRQTDYQKFAGGQYFFTQEEVRNMLDGYLRFSQRNTFDVVFIICSDGVVEQSAFDGLNIALPAGNMVEDLFTLARTDVIIGSNSTYGAFASYYGNIPFVVFERGNIEWEYYRDKKGYFENKKNALVHY
ncbi:hypothetical protein A3C91_02305 [Candidatus Azambacteria bacterium RIFCSPHIGHO2_02_FULL_52_12]|uniref:Glycosyl transferase family 11 n=1 Tax=Candidatus Azambacteria bacterium RIFCSPLOWO2_01_FULL_46_25 TaxID=1797298 RepID=A0A1F5BVN8_9BACT|nr:MAG: hypothetical protein A3C91_02305 [Candidatus Azambacteria bacterium RIFCSPHIGHO2_02_FULL_52_12]OGD34656.1 MAG: hypothetical protein A2988_04105 [Candidatus Azambacteria bacterium RIFCSPLOWO2_01_FULL_46_25]OGD36361.1 MAG: hypothetical protein A2850_03105 [Candidatus Azambacteria bacterium RIFCSPHIGHO2_01_FULL_51_74]